MSFKVREQIGDAEPIIRSKFSPKMRTITETGDESKVQHHFQDACDINRIAGTKDVAFGHPDDVLDARARYGDFSDVMDFATNMDKAVKAQALFDSIPVELRNRCGNTIHGLFNFINDPKNRETCYEYNIFSRPVDPTPSPMANKDGSQRKVKVQPESSDT